MNKEVFLEKMKGARSAEEVKALLAEAGGME